MSAKKTALTTLTIIIIPTTIVALIAAIVMMTISPPPTAANAQNITTTTAASSTNKTFYLFTAEVEAVHEKKLGFGGDVFSLPIMVVNKGDTVTVHFYNVENETSERHSFTIGAPYNIDKDLAGGENATATFTADQVGVFEYRCKYHLPEMIGELVVLPK